MSLILFLHSPFVRLPILKPTRGEDWFEVSPAIFSHRRLHVRARACWDAEILGEVVPQQKIQVPPLGREPKKKRVALDGCPKDLWDPKVSN